MVGAEGTGMDDNRKALTWPYLWHAIAQPPSLMTSITLYHVLPLRRGAMWCRVKPGATVPW